jgi:tagaturonate reductase
VTAPLPRRPLQFSADIAGRRQPLPEKVLQFGEGNFLRAFVDWMLERMSRAGLFHGAAVLIQPLPHGNAGLINEQDGLYTVALRGLHQGQTVDSRELVSSVTRCIDPYADFAGFLRCGLNPDTRFVVSNTTEAGIRLDPADAPDARPAASFPAKLTQLLHARFRHFDGDPARGWIMLPCELIERNGDALRQAVADTARRWQLEPAFLDWLDSACRFVDTLVDRIVTGYPTEDAPRIHAEIGWDDRLLVAAEPYHSWVIGTREGLEEELPLRRAGLDVVWTDDVAPYRDRKVRILNGTHTMAAAIGRLAGLATVSDCMADIQIRGFLAATLAEEILPTLRLPAAELDAFTQSVFERFRNPFLRHRLDDIALNSTSKFRTRLLGAVEDQQRACGRPPRRLTFALAAVIASCRAAGADRVTTPDDTAPLPVRDEPAALHALHAAWSGHVRGPLAPAVARAVVAPLLGDASLWGSDLAASLPGIDEAVATHVAAICTTGVRAALAAV